VLGQDGTDRLGVFVHEAAEFDLSTTVATTATIARVTSRDDTAARDRRLLVVSVWASVGFAVLSSVWGVLSGSAMIVFDWLLWVPETVHTARDLPVRPRHVPGMIR
jgi:hypothetical protein